MPRYDVPKEFDSEDKIIGGNMSLRQFVYLLVLALVDVGLFFGLSFMSIVSRLIILIPLTVLVLALAFFEHPEYGRLDSFFLRLIRYYRTGKIYR